MKTGFTNPATAPFVMNHSSLLPPDDDMLRQRKDDITLYLASNKMLLGTDQKNIDMIIFCRPFNQPAGLIQGAGRGARRTTTGFRSSVQVYQLYNSSDLTIKNKDMSADMRRLCRESRSTCTKAALRQIFAGDSSGQVELGEQEKQQQRQNCCHFHDLQCQNEEEASMEI